MSVLSLTGKSDFEQVQRVEDDGGDDPAAHAGQEVLIFGRADRRGEAGDPPPNEAASAPVAAHLSAVFKRCRDEAQLGGGGRASAGFGSVDRVFGGGHFAKGRLKLRISYSVIRHNAVNAAMKRWKLIILVQAGFSRSKRRYIRRPNGQAYDSAISEFVKQV